MFPVIYPDISGLQVKVLPLWLGASNDRETRANYQVRDNGFARYSWPAFRP